MSTTFDVIIPTYDNADELQACLEGLWQQTFTSFRLLLCIDGASAAVRRLVESVRLPGIDSLVLGHPQQAHRGRNATRNLALPHLRAPYLAMLDSDVVPLPEWLAEHYALLQSEDCVSLGDVRYTNTDDNVWARYLQRRGKNKYRDRQQVPTYYLATGNLAMPSRLFVALGGQDERMHGYGGGDTEFALRLEKHCAVPVIFNARAIGTSRMNKTLTQALAQLEQFGAENLPYIHQQHPTEQRIFGLQYLLGRRLRDRVLRKLALSRLPQWLGALVPNSVGPIERAIVHFAVFSAIARGWERRSRGDQEVAAQ